MKLMLPVIAMMCAACAPRGIMTYKQTEVYGRPVFRMDGSVTAMSIADGNRPTDQTIWWNDDALDHRKIDSGRRYRFELLEGVAVDERGTQYKSSEVFRVYGGQELVYDASYCRLHRLTMPRVNRQGGVDAESLPRGFDEAKVRYFPNSMFDHAACNSMVAYSSLDWCCPQCSEAETRWIERNARGRSGAR